MNEPIGETIQPISKTIEIKRDLSRLAINPHGARIEELVLGGQTIFWKGVRGDGKDASTHPCIPIFGPETTTRFGIPQHGSARNKNFKAATIGGDLILNQDITDGKYPKGLSISQACGLSDREFSLTTKVSNNGEQTLPVNFAEHFYWNVLNGWKGLKINGIDVTDVVKKDGAISLLSRNKIVIPGQKPIILEQKGFSLFQLWAGKNPEGKFDQHYVCIEPAEGDPAKNFFGSKDSMIKPQQSRTTEITISLT